MTKIIYYLTPNGKNPVKKFIDFLEKRQKVKIFRIFQYVEVYGLSSILPHVKKLSGTELWEIRILGKDNIRILYFFINRESIVLLHAFTKKTQKTSKREIITAISRLSQYKRK